MNLRFISPTVHGVIDYSAAVALILGPMLFGLGTSSELAWWLSVVTGVAVILVSINTIYKFGLFNMIPFDLHLAIDLSAATTFAVAPFLFGFEGMDMYYYIANSVVVFLVVALSDNSKN